MKLKLFTGISILSILLTACATKASIEGSKTKQINEELKNNCIFIESNQVSSSVKFGPMANKETVENEIKNQTALNGGNAYYINSFIETSFGHYSSSFEVYKCPETKYTMSKQYHALKELKRLFEEGILSKDEYDKEKFNIINSYQK